jgi:hypothetical protein
MNLLTLAAVLGITILAVSCASTNSPTLEPPAQQFPFALSRENPVEVCKPAGQRDYLAGLVCTSGGPPSFKRVKSVGPRVDYPKDLPAAKTGEFLDRMISGAKLRPGEVDYHVVDEYELICGEKKFAIFLDMYHCDGQVKNVAPIGFSLRAVAQEANFDGVSKVLDQLRKSVGSQEYTQIKEAIEASATLKISLDRLYSQKAFTEFVVLTKREPTQSQYGGFESKGRVYLTQDFLQSLAQYRPRPPVYADDLQPNNTTFAIAHLLHHISKPIDISKFSNPSEYSAANLAIEAESFLVAWNSMIDAAEKANNGKSLSNRQAGQLLMSSRYPFPFIGKSITGDSLRWLPDGRFLVDPANTRIVADVLANSKLPDIK